MPFFNYANVMSNIKEEEGLSYDFEQQFLRFQEQLEGTCAKFLNKLEDEAKSKRKADRAQSASSAGQEVKDQRTYPEVMEGNARKLDKIASGGSGGCGPNNPGGNTSKLWEKNKMLASLLAKQPSQPTTIPPIPACVISGTPQDKLPRVLSKQQQPWASMQSHGGNSTATSATSAKTSLQNQRSLAHRQPTNMPCLNQLLSTDDNGATIKKERPEDKKSSNKKIQDDLWSTVSETNDEYEDDKNSFKSYRTDFCDRYDDAGYRLSCLELLKSWNMNYHGTKGPEASDFLGYLSDFRKFAKISDEILLDMLPSIFDNKTRMWYRVANFATWGEFKISFFREFIAGYRPKNQSFPSPPDNPYTVPVPQQGQPMMPPKNNLSGPSWTLPQVPWLYPQFDPVSGIYPSNHPNCNTYY